MWSTEEKRNAQVFNIRRKQAVCPPAGTKFELAETYSYEEFASRVAPRRALRHLTALLACQDLVAWTP